MICKSCKCQMPDDARFCPQCGEKVIRDTGSAQSMQLVCKSCGSVLSCDEDKPILFCPSCGSKELLAESDAVKIERMRTKAQRDIEISRQQTYKEVELNRIKTQSEKEEEAQIEKKATSYKKGKLYKWTIVFLFFSVLSCVSAFSSHRVLQSIVAIIQVSCFALSLLTGLQIILRKKHNLHVLLVILGLILIVPVSSLGPGSSSRTRSSDTFIWPVSGLSTRIPKPETNEGMIISDYDTGFSVSLHNVTAEQHSAYYLECVEMGFTLDASGSSSSYEAFDKDGYKLSLDYYSGLEYMSIDIDPPKPMSEITWPQSALPAMIPTPVSKQGYVEKDSASAFRIYIGNTDKEQYAVYVQACIDKGFDYEHDRTEKRYKAKNKKGYALTITYEGNNVMYIKIEAP